MWIMALAAAAAYFVKGLCGFANTLVFSSIVGFAANNVNISPIELLLGYPSNVVVALKERHSVDPKVCIPLSALVLIGNIPGILLLKNADVHIIKCLFGIVIVLLGIEMLLRERGISHHVKPSRVLMSIMGLLSGLLCGLYGVGALLAAYMSRATDDASAFRGNLRIIFIVENTFRIIAYSASGIITSDILRQAFMLLPAMAMGLFMGLKCGDRIHASTVKRIVIAMLIASGITLFMGSAAAIFTI